MERVLKLSEPVVVDGRTVTEVTVRSPRVKDMRLVDKLEGLDRGMRLASTLTGLPLSALEELITGDYEAIHEAATALGKSRTAGETSPAT
jgi:hypothetical protein